MPTKPKTPKPEENANEGLLLPLDDICEVYWKGPGGTLYQLAPKVFGARGEFVLRAVPGLTVTQED